MARILRRGSHMVSKHLVALVLAGIAPLIVLLDIGFLKHRLDLVQLERVSVRASSIHYRRFEYTVLAFQDGRRLQLHGRRLFSAEDYLLITRTSLLRLVVRVEAFNGIGSGRMEKLAAMLPWLALLTLLLNVMFILARLDPAVIIVQAVFLSAVWVQASTLS